MRNIFVFGFTSLFLATLPCSAHGADLVKQVKQWDTTWTFSEPVRAGQFVTGDWWIVPNAGESSVTVVSVDPAPTKSANGKHINGSVINPIPGYQECLDERSRIWKPEGLVTYPVTLKPGDSLVSANSYPAEVLTAAAGDKKQSVFYIAVLTCLDKPAAPTDFRPGFAGTDKTIYSSLNLHRDLLPNLPVVGTPPDIKQLTAARFSRPWVEWPTDCDANETRGAWESSYGREKAVDVGAGVLTLCLDSKTVGDKEPLLLGLVQTGIDLYTTLEAGGRWPSNGGHDMGRKLPILFAGLMLGNQDMLGIGKDPKYGPSTNTFQEDSMAFIVAKEDVNRQLDITVHGLAKAAGPDSIGIAGGKPGGWPYLQVPKGNKIKIVSGPGAGQERTITKDNTIWAKPPPDPVICTVSPPWDTMPVVGQSEYQILGYAAEDVGRAAWSWFHVSQPKKDNPSVFQNYGDMNKRSWTAEILAARILGLKDEWNQPAVFQLEDEWLAAPLAPGEKWSDRFHGEKGTGQRPFDVQRDFIAKMWLTYRSKYGGDWKAPAEATAISK